ncbi:hypothetical protein BJX61DRAFT_547853, partial [Aspergillus egyptiacus]
MTLHTGPEPLREWIILIPDVEGSLEARMRVRETHVNEMMKQVDAGLFQMGGATLNENSIDGSAIIARAETEAEILEVLRTDIYVRSGVWDLARARFIPSTAIIQREHQVYVKVEYAAFNPTDRLALDSNAFGDGALLGCDFAGTVVEVHSSVSRLRAGDKIAGFVWGGETKGMCTIADERLSFEISQRTSAAQACSVPLPANTAWLGLFSEDCLAFRRENSTKKPPLLIWGGNCYFAIQLAKLHSIEVATTCSPKSFDKVRQAGASHVFDYHDPGVISKIKSALPDLGRVFDTIGNATSSTTAAEAIISINREAEAVLCTVRPGKANTHHVPSHVNVRDVFVFTVFPTEHHYRNIAHWP